MSIFKKDCPECARPNNVDAVRCGCGYCFDPEALAGADAAEYQEEQDRLYRDYLAARVVQAEMEMKVAREQANLDRENTLKGATALAAEQSFKSLKAELQQLSLRIPANKPQRPSAPKPAPAPVVKAVPKPNPPAKPAVVPRAVTPAPTAPRHKFQAKPAEIKKLLPAPTRQAEKPKPRPAETKRAAVPIRPRMADKLPITVKQIVVPKPAPMVQASKPAVVETPAPKAPAPVSRPALVASVPVNKPQPQIQPRAEAPKPRATTVPNLRFRRLQAKKAHAIMQASRAPVADAPKPAAVAPIKKESAVPTQECPSCTAAVPLHITQCRCGYAFSKPSDVPALALETPVAVQAAEGQECPNCTATVPHTRSQCGCGYTFSQSTEMVPALALDAGALAILTDGIGGTRRR